jgi:hypothetical protein
LAGHVRTVEREATMTPLTTYIPVPDIPFLIMLMLTVPALTYVSVRLADYANRRWFRRAKREIADAWKEIADERDAIARAAEQVEVDRLNLEDAQEELITKQRWTICRTRTRMRHTSDTEG